PPPDQPRPVPRTARAHAAGPHDAHALHGTGARFLEAVPVLRGPWGRAGAGGTRRAARVPGPVPQPGPFGGGRLPVRPFRSRDLRAVPAGPRGARAPPRGVGAPPGPAAPAPRGPRPAAAGGGRVRGGRALRPGLRPPL